MAPPASRPSRGPRSSVDPAGGRSSSCRPGGAGHAMAHPCASHTARHRAPADGPTAAARPASGSQSGKARRMPIPRRSSTREAPLPSSKNSVESDISRFGNPVCPHDLGSSRQLERWGSVMAAQIRQEGSIDASARVRLQLLGAMRVEADGTPVDLPSRKVRAMLAFVALRHGHDVPRGVLTSLLWGDRAEAQARASLRQSLSEVRAAFPDNVPLPIQSDHETVRWDVASATADVLDLERLARDGTSGTASLAEDVPLGDLLEGFSLNEASFEQWLAGERERVRQLQCTALSRCMSRAADAGDIAGALRHGLALLGIDPLQEHVHRAVMTFYESLGRRDAALAQYHRLEQELSTQLGVQPDVETSELARSIRSRRNDRVIPPRENDGPTPRAQLSIAVLPFLSLSDDRQHGFFADGMTEDIISALSRVADFLVISRSSSFVYRGRPVRAEVAARELGVRYILEGSVRVAGQHVRVNAQLIDTTSGGQIWGERFDGSLDDIFTVQDEITRSIAVSLQVRLSKGESARLWEGQTRNLRAWEAMTLGRQAFYRFTTTDNFIARQHFQEAIRLDPTFTGAIAQLGISHYWDARYSVSLDRQASCALAEEQAETLIRLAPDHSATYSLRACLALLQFRYDEAIALGRRAVELAPSDSRVGGYLALLHVYGGSCEEAIALLAEAKRMCPHPDAWMTYFSAVANLWAGDLRT